MSRTRLKRWMMLLGSLAVLLAAAPSVAQQWPEGWISKAKVQQSTERARERLHECYVEHVPASSRKHGDIVKLRVTVSEAGNVFRVDFLESSYKSTKFESCVRQIFEQTKFGVKPTEKMVYLQKLGFQNGAANLQIDPPRKAGGAITRETVEAMAKQRKDELMACYEPVAEKDDDLRGQVLFEVVIDGSTGQVQSVKKVKSTLGNATVEACALGVIRTFSFPVPTDPGLVIVQFPVTFQ